MFFRTRSTVSQNAVRGGRFIFSLSFWHLHFGFFIYDVPMNLEELNTSQVVLLTMLVSFVTSIATGIVTASLMEEAPADVTRVVQRVVERTVETVTPAEQSAAAVVTERTVVVKESDMLAGAIAHNNSRVVRILMQDANATTTTAVAEGVALDATHVATDAAKISAEGVYFVSVPGVEAPIAATLADTGGARGVAILITAEGAPALSAVDSSEGATVLGQTIFAFVAGNNGKIITGVIDELKTSGYVGTTLDPTRIAPGTTIFNTDGIAVGMSTSVSREEGAAVFVPMRAVLAKLTAPTPSEEAPSESGGVTE